MTRQHSLFDPEPNEPSFPSRCSEAPSGFVPLSDLAPPSENVKSGIARIAAEAPEVDFRNDVEYRDLPCGTLISNVDSRRAPFNFSINPYRGCEFGCVYCYARYTHEYLELENWLDFERKIFVKRGAREALVRDLRRLDLRGKWLAIGTATDPYQPAERRHRITRGILEVLAGRRGLRLSITTKSDLVMRDLDLLRAIREHNDIEVNFTITTPHHQLARKIEPRAARPDRRLLAVKTLSDAGIRAGVFLMPLMPRINDRAEDIELLAKRASESGAAYLATQVLFLRNCSKKRFFPFIEERFPELLPYYRRMYSSYRSEALALYTREKMAEVGRIKRQYGLQNLYQWNDVPPDQLSLL